MKWIKDHWKLLSILFVIFISGFFIGGVFQRLAIKKDCIKTIEFIKCRK